nr:SPOR domain-containing protein [Neoroseomonas alba]
MHVSGPRSVPVIEPDPRPFKVRPDDPGGLRVPNQDELIFERNRGSNAQPPAARLAPEPEAPRIDALRAQVAQPSSRPAPAAEGVTLPPRAAAPTAAAPPATAPATSAPAATTPAPAAQTAAAPARPAPVPNGRIRVQLGALTSDEAARGEWDRLSGRYPDLLGAFRPQVVRFEREGQATLYRLRTGGFADVAAAQAFCEQAREQRIPCIIVR